MRLSRTEFDALERRIAAAHRRIERLESVMTPGQRAELVLLEKARHVVEVARAEGQLTWEPPL